MYVTHANIFTRVHDQVRRFIAIVEPWRGVGWEGVSQFMTNFVSKLNGEGI